MTFTSDLSHSCSSSLALPLPLPLPFSLAPSAVPSALCKPLNQAHFQLSCQRHGIKRAEPSQFQFQFQGPRPETTSNVANDQLGTTATTTTTTTTTKRRLINKQMKLLLGF